MADINLIPKRIRELYSIVADFEKDYPERKFTLDGHLVGSIGEVAAAYLFDLQLLETSAETHDATTRDGRKVQIKATQKSSVAFRGKPELVIVLRLSEIGGCDVVYNGPGDQVWSNCGKKQSNGQRSISLAKLRRLMDMIEEVDKIVQVRQWPSDRTE